MNGHNEWWGLLRYYRLWDDDQLPSAVSVLPSMGLEKLNLGLADKTSESWRSEVSVIVHCAAEVSGVRPYAALHAPNVVGVRVMFQKVFLLDGIESMSFILTVSSEKDFQQ